MNKAIFLDRDGTINIDKDYLYRIEDFQFTSGLFEALHLFQDNGFILVIITNQSGIARGYYSEKDFIILDEWMIATLNNNGIQIKKTYYCPHHPSGHIEKYRKFCNCRKPLLGLFKQAIQDFNIDLSRSYAIGDKIRDVSICKESNCKGFLIGYNESLEVISDVKAGNYKNVEYAQDLFACSKKIVTMEKIK